jgi:hypothetical protein
MQLKVQRTNMTNIKIYIPGLKGAYKNNFYDRLLLENDSSWFWACFM